MTIFVSRREPPPLFRLPSHKHERDPEIAAGDEPEPRAPEREVHDSDHERHHHHEKQHRPAGVSELQNADNTTLAP